MCTLQKESKLKIDKSFFKTFNCWELSYFVHNTYDMDILLKFIYHRCTCPKYIIHLVVSFLCQTILFQLVYKIKLAVNLRYSDGKHDHFTTWKNLSKIKNKSDTPDLSCRLKYQALNQVSHKLNMIQENEVKVR